MDATKKRRKEKKKKENHSGLRTQSEVFVKKQP